MDDRQKKGLLAVVALVAVASVVLYAIMKNPPSESPSNGNGNVAVNAPTNAPVTPPPALVGTYVNSTAAMIGADSVTANSTTQVTIVGQAVGNWFFEASFPVEILDNANNVIGQGIAEAQTDWMVVTMVPYVAVITLNAPYSGPATVVLHKDNPSGEPVNDASVSFNVTL